VIRISSGCCSRAADPFAQPRWRARRSDGAASASRRLGRTGKYPGDCSRVQAKGSGSAMNWRWLLVASCAGVGGIFGFSTSRDGGEATRSPIALPSSRPPAAGSTTSGLLAGETFHDFHDVELISSPTEVTHRFTLKNTSEYPMEITNLAASCGCTVAKLSTTQLSPGEGVDVNVSLRLFVPGTKSESVAMVLKVQDRTEAVKLVVKARATAVREWFASRTKFPSSSGVVRGHLFLMQPPSLNAPPRPIVVADGNSIAQVGTWTVSVPRTPLTRARPAAPSTHPAASRRGTPRRSPADSPAAA